MFEPLRGPVMMELSIEGQAAGAGSKVAEPLGKRFNEARDRDGRIILKYRPSSKFTAPWMEKVKEKAEEAWRLGWPSSRVEPLRGPVFLDLTFFELRPKSHYFADGRLRADAPLYPHQTSTHDYDKLRRAISDSLTQAKVFADDKRVVAGAGWKFYADYAPRLACAVIRVGEMESATVGECADFDPPPPEGQTTP